MIFVTDAKEATDVATLLKKLGMNDLENVIVVDARADNKPSASIA